MPGLLQSSVGLLRSRLSRRIVAWVFLSLLVIEGIIFVPSYYRRKREKLRDLETVSTEVLAAVKTNLMAGMTPAQLIQLLHQQLGPDSIIQGVALYTADGRLLGQFGNAPRLDVSHLGPNQTLRHLSLDYTNYDVAWPRSQFQDSYILAVRHDATSVKWVMRQYVLSIAGLVILISAFVTFVTILVLERLLINPLLRLRQDLLAAGDAVSQAENPEFFSLSMERNDELGDVAKAFGQMFYRVRHEIEERKQAEVALIGEQEKSERLLRNILPASIADQLKQETGAIASRFEAVTILFADLVDFTSFSAHSSPSHLVQLLNQIFSTFDGIADRLELEKIKTIGDAYMVVGGLPSPRADHAERVLTMALEMLSAVNQFQRDDGQSFRLRIGINTGPVVAGVIGIKKFSYDLWGDAVNIASRMESHGIADRIQVSESTYQALKHQYDFEFRGIIQIKGRGPMPTYLYPPEFEPVKGEATAGE